MKDRREEDRLKEAFRGLRAETTRSGRVPDFGSVLGGAKREAAARPSLEIVTGGGETGRRAPRRLMRTGAWASAAVAAAVAGLILVDRGPSGDDDFERLVAAYTSETSAGSWSSPTSGLLAVPGMDLMRSLPSIGEPVRGIDPSGLPVPRPSPEEENL